MTILDLGCGRTPKQDGVIRLDVDYAVHPDYICFLGYEHIPLDDNSVDMARAIHVLEHIGKQGDTGAWFHFWQDLYRVLKPEGLLYLESPMWNSVWAWADPSHSRALSPEAFAFLNQDNYRIAGSSISPFRLQCDFVPVGPWRTIDGGHFGGMLRARKPLQPWWRDAEKDLTAQSV